MEPKVKIHKFELAGLGKSPFRFIGMFEKLGPIVISQEGGVTHTVGAPGQPMGTCDYCGEGIAYCFQLESADGKSFVVGSTCINKSGDSGLKTITNEKVREIKRNQRHAKEAEKLKELAVLTADTELMEKAKALPHPMKWAQDQGKTFYDYIQWYIDHAGTSGKLWLIKEIKKKTA